MECETAILAMMIVVLLIVIVFQCRGSGHHCPAPPADAFDANYSPRAPYHVQDGLLRGARQDAYNQDHAYRRADLAKNYRAWAATPRNLEEAQRAAWFEAVEFGHNATHDPEKGHDVDHQVQHHTPGSMINYQDALVDLVADDRMRAQHMSWHSEVAPKSQTAMRVDDMAEASAMSSNRGHGVYAFRFSAPSQYNPLFITDQDAESYSPQATKFALGS